MISMAIPVMNGAIGRSRGYLEYSQAHDAEEVGAFPKRMIVGFVADLWLIYG